MWRISTGWRATTLAGPLGPCWPVPPRPTICTNLLQAGVRRAGAVPRRGAVRRGGGPSAGERRLQLRELKQAYVFSTLLAKKTRVREGGSKTHPGAAANCGMALLGHGREAVHCAATGRGTARFMGSPTLASRHDRRPRPRPLLAATAAVQDIFTEYFSTPPDPGPRSLLGFFWLLFCTARAALLPPQADLVTSFALLLACTHFMLRNMPRQHLRHAEQQQQAADALLAAVAASHSAAEHAATVRQLAGLLQLLLAQVLQPSIAAVPVAAQDAQQQQQQAMAGAAAPAAPPLVWLSFPGLVDADRQAAAAAVEAAAPLPAPDCGC